MKQFNKITMLILQPIIFFLIMMPLVSFAASLVTEDNTVANAVGFTMLLVMAWGTINLFFLYLRKVKKTAATIKSTKRSAK